MQLRATKQPSQRLLLSQSQQHSRRPRQISLSPLPESQKETLSPSPRALQDEGLELLAAAALEEEQPQLPTDTILREYESNAERLSLTPPSTQIPHRPSPQSNRFSSIARQIVDRDCPDPIGPDDSTEDEHLAIEVTTAAYIDKDKTPHFAKLVPSINDFYLMTWKKKAKEKAQQ